MRRGYPGLSGLASATVVSGLVLVPIGVAQGGSELLDPGVLHDFKALEPTRMLMTFVARLLVRHRFAVHWSYLYIAVIVTIVSVFHLLLRWIEEAWYGRAIARTPVRRSSFLLLGSARSENRAGRGC